MINSWQNAAAITSGLVLSLAVQQINPAQAAIVTYNLAGTIDNGLLTGKTFSGTFSYDNSPLTGSGFESLVSQVNLNFFGSTFTAVDDDSYPDNPTVEFLDGSFLGLNFSVSSSTPAVYLIPAFGNTVATFSYIGTNNDSGSGNIQYTIVPESSTVLGILGIGIVGFLGRSKPKSR